MSSTPRSSSARSSSATSSSAGRFSVASTVYGAPGLDALRGCISRIKGTDALAPVTVIVPNNLAGVVARRALASGNHGAVVAGLTGLLNVDFLTVQSFAELLAAPILARRGKRHAGAVVVAAAVRESLNKEAGVFAPVARHATTERRLLAAHRDLNELNEGQLEALASTSTQARDVVRIHGNVNKLLRDFWYQEQELLEVALRAIAADDRNVVLPRSVVVYLPQQLSPKQAELLCATSTRFPTSVLVGLTGVDAADATVFASLRLLGINRPAPPPAMAVVSTVEMINTSDADDEVRAVVRGIVDAARAGSPFERMAVLHPRQGPYPRLLHDHLQAAGIPTNARSVTTLAQTTTGRALRRLLLLAQRDYHREDISALLAGYPMRWARQIVPSRVWDQISRDAGIIRGAQDWSDKLERFIHELTSRSEHLESRPETDGSTSQLTDQIHRARNLQAFMIDLQHAIGHGQTLTTWSDRAAWCQGLLRRYSGDQNSWPDDERQATQQIHAVLDSLAGLDSIEPQPSAETFDRTLEAQLQERVARQNSSGNGVLVGQLELSIGLDLDHVWIVGMAEGSLPGRVRDDSLLTGLSPPGNDVDDEHRHFLVALGAVGPHGVAHLLRPRGDLRRSGDLSPSRWLVDLAVQRTGRALRPADLDQMPETWSHHVPSFAGGVLEAGFPATSQEFRLRSLVQQVDADGRVHHESLADLGSSLAAGAALQAGRASTTFTRFDGNLASVTVPRDIAGTLSTSATALETYARCPHQYFVRHILGVQPVETPEYRLRVDPLTRGNIIHRVLERFVREQGLERSSGEVVRWSAHDREQLRRMAQTEFQVAQEQGLTGDPLFWRRDKVLLMRDLEAFVDADNDRRSRHQLRPIATELAFGLHGSPAVEICLPDGHSVLISGSIDLVDQGPGGDLTVVDYKTGRAVKLSADKPHNGGTRLQLVLYAVAARALFDRHQAQVTSLYWHVNAAEKYRTVGYRVTPEVAALTLGAVATIAEGIGFGVYPQHPKATGYEDRVDCVYCDPDGLGTGDARRRLLRKAGQAELAAYLRLVEPDLVGGIG